MISDEDLRRIAEDDHVHCGDASAMAKELQAYRKAFKHPAIYVLEKDLNSDSGHILTERRWSSVCDIPLYRKPTMPEQEI